MAPFLCIGSVTFIVSGMHLGSDSDSAGMIDIEKDTASLLQPN
jgi:hypothetical protein